MIRRPGKTSILRPAMAGMLLVLGFAAVWFIRRDDSLRLSLGQVQVTFRQSLNWSLTELQLADVPLMATRSGNGVVLRDASGVWHGATHGEEELLEAQLLVDGKAVPLEPGRHYHGRQMKLRRRLRFPACGTVEHVLIAREGLLREEFSLDLEPASEPPRTMYGYLGTRANRLTSWEAQDASEISLASGRTANDDDTMPSLPEEATTVVQRDPDRGVWLRTEWDVPEDARPRAFIWDRDQDNKLYVRFEGVEQGSVTRLNYAVTTTWRTP